MDFKILNTIGVSTPRTNDCPPTPPDVSEFGTLTLFPSLNDLKLFGLIEGWKKLEKQVI